MAQLHEMTISEFTEVMNYLLDNNRQLEKQGLTPIAIGLEGAAGIGKTAVIEEVAKKRGMTFCKLNLSQLEEVGDLCGYPLQEVLLIAKWKDKEGNEKTSTKWWPVNTLNQAPKGVQITNTTRMGYAAPAWLPREENENGCVLLLDDYTRKMNKNASFLA